MTTAEAFLYVKERQPQFIHVTGKTSTGKSTFSRRLKDELGYEVIDLDAEVDNAVIQPLQLKQRGQVFFEVYKHRNKLDWIERIVVAVQQKMRTYTDNGQRVVVEGAIANVVTLQELLAPFPETEIIYFHPDSLETYRQYLTNRFMLTTPDYHAGLPIAFWELVDDDAFRRFCQDRVPTPHLQKAIRDYAAASQAASKDRLADLQKHFVKIRVVNI
jgi:hypothetical protein